MNMARILMLGGLTASLAIPAIAQTQITPGATPDRLPSAPSQTRNDDVIVAASVLEAGANSYTEGQFSSRLEANGFTAIGNMRKDDNGFWRGTATHGGTSGDVAMDFRGRIAHGVGVATIGPRPVSTGSGGTPITGPAGSAAPDGTAGNPPGTAAGRAVDRAVGPNVRDGAPGNPPGTAVGRAVDRAVGPNVPDGAPGNPPGTAAGRAVERAVGPNVPDGTPGNPPGTAVGRAVDRNAGTNTTGTNPAPAQR